MEIIKLNLIPSGVNPTCHCSQYDNGRVIRIELFDGLTPYTLQSGDTVTLNVRKPDNTIVTASLTATQGNKYVDLVTTEQICACVGYNLCDLTITNGSVVIGTLNFIMQVERDVLADGIPSQSVIEDLDALVQEAVGDNYYTKSEVYNKTESDAALTLKANATEVEAIKPPFSTTFTLNQNVDGTGRISQNSYTALSDKIFVSAGDIVIRTLQAKDSNNITLIFYVSEFAENNTFIKRTSLSFGNSITISSNTAYIYLSFGRASSSGVQISQNDIDTYFKVGLYRKALSYSDYNNNGFVNRGLLQDLGYTSLSDCSKSGFYTFNSAWASSAQGLPSNWTGGGCVITYNNSGSIWQRVFNNNYSFVRYSLIGAWFNENDNFVRVSYINESGDDNSTEQLYIDIKVAKTGKKIRFAMGHCIDASINSDVWRLMYIAQLNSADTETKITRRGEFECALHLADRSDFSGGIVHGDEVDQQVAFFANGSAVNVNATSGIFNKFVIVRNSILYDPADNETPIAEHGAEYIFDENGLTLNQSIKWLVADNLTYCYLAMLPILKTYSEYRYDDTSFNVKQNSLTNYSFSIPNAKSVTEYGGGVRATMSITNYPTGLTGGDRATITDNSGINYNKVYFVICTSGQSQIDELWKSTTIYKVD